MLFPMTVKNIPITLMIAAQPITWIVAIARFEILVRIIWLSTGKHFRDHVELPLLAASSGYHEPGMTPYRQMCVEIRTVLTRSRRLGQFLSGRNIGRCNTNNEAIGCSVAVRDTIQLVGSPDTLRNRCLAKGITIASRPIVSGSRKYSGDEDAKIHCRVGSCGPDYWTSRNRASGCD